MSAKQPAQTQTQSVANEAAAIVFLRFQQFATEAPEPVKVFIGVFIRELLSAEMPGHPPWVSAAAERLFKMFFPTVTKEELHEPDSLIIGKFMGHTLALCLFFKTKETVFGATGVEMMTQLHGLIARSIGQLLASSSYDAKEIISGLKIGIDRTVDANGSFLGAALNSDVLFQLVIHWREIASLSSIPSIHKRLVALLGASRAGDLKRTEKLCQRIGLRPRSRTGAKGIRHPSP